MKVDRRFMHEHIEELLAVERESFPDPKNGNIFSSVYEEAATHMHYFVSPDERGAVGGYLMLSIAVTEAEIINVAVRAILRRRGIAERLVTEALAFARAQGVVACYLEVRESNLPARRLYEKVGFVVVGRRKMYYSAPEEDALVMKFSMESPCSRAPN